MRVESQPLDRFALRTQREVALELGLSRMTVWDIEREVLFKFRCPRALATNDSLKVLLMRSRAWLENVKRAAVFLGEEPETQGEAKELHQAIAEFEAVVASAVFEEG